ncbi:MAG: FAD-binding protein, partial [Eggerthellaceae bacterium]|nr:FAD-binding protein [Eggerthellaceae bacterium]
MSDEKQGVVEYPNYSMASDFAESVAELEPITEFAGEKTYDIVVVGAGTAGVPAVLTALEEGATVC